MLQDLLEKICSVETNKIVLPEDFTILSTVKQVSEKYNDTSKRIDSLSSLLEKIRGVEPRIDSSDKQIKQLEAEEELLKEQLDTCPQCGTELTEESKAILLER